MIDQSGKRPMEIIRSPQNPTIRRLVQLRKHRRRRAAGVVLVDGARETLRAIEAGLTLRAYFEPVDDFALPSVPSGDPSDFQSTGNERSDVESGAVRSAAIAAGVYCGVSKGVFEKIGYGDASRGCVAEFTAPGDRIIDLPNPSPGLILVLDRVEKPGNVGAIFRSADAAGVAAVLMCDCPSDRFNSNAIRGSLGAVFTVASASGSIDEVNDYLSRHVDQVFAMRVEGACSLHETDLRGTCVAVILGSEADGLADRWRQWGPADRRSDVTGVKLPMTGLVDSLNVSVSAAIVAYEALRQRSK